jgi:hypothetical protein
VVILCWSVWFYSLSWVGPISLLFDMSGNICLDVKHYKFHFIVCPIFLCFYKYSRASFWNIVKTYEWFDSFGFPFFRFVSYNWSSTVSRTNYFSVNKQVPELSTLPNTPQIKRFSTLTGSDSHCSQLSTIICVLFWPER